MNPWWPTAAGAIGAAVGIGAARNVLRLVLPPPPTWHIWWLPTALAASLTAVNATRYDWWGLPATLVFTVGAWWLAGIDAYTHRLPDRILLPVAAAVTAVLAVSALATGHAAELGWAAVGAAASGLVMWSVHLITRGGVGFGDVKLATVTGLITGAASRYLIPLPLFLASTAAAVLLATRRKDVALGPLLVAATVICIVASEAVLA